MATIHDANGTVLRSVKNLGWLIRNASQVEALIIDPPSFWDLGRSACACVLIARLHDGRLFTCPFASLSICRAWIKRPCMRHVTTVVDTMPEGI